MSALPEAQILFVVAALIALAYLIIYPRYLDKPRPVTRIYVTDAALTLGAIIVAWLRFGGTGTRFSLLFFDTNWLIFTLIVYVVAELPVSFLFFRRHGIDPFRDD